MQKQASIFKVSALFSMLLSAASTGACDEAARTNPNWIDDVQPEIQGSCIRCHSRPARGGAPDTFRLDVYRNTQLKDGTVIYGAETMAEYIEQRAGVDGTMPPDFAGGDRLRDTFVNWFQAPGQTPARGTRADNATPQVVLLSALPVVDKEVVTVEYEISDSDGDIVHGRLSVGGIVVADDLHSGKGSVEFFAGGFADGDYDVVAEISDGRSTDEQVRRGFIDEYPIQLSIGTLQVVHDDGNTAPLINLERLIPEAPTSIPVNPNPALIPGGAVHDLLYADSQGPARLRISITDPDVDTHDVTIVAFRGGEEIAVDTLQDVNATVDYDWDTSTIPEGPGWRLRLTATDSQGATHTIESGRVFISHSSTTDTYDTISQVIADNCGVCHFDPAVGGRIPYLSFPLNGLRPPADAPDDVKLAYEFVYYQISYNGGIMYRRAVEERNMPPVSAASFFSERLNGGVLSDAERARIADYLLGGSPR